MKRPIKNFSANSPSLLGEYFAFLQAPTYDQIPRSFWDILTRIWRLFALQFLVVDIPALILIRIVSQWITSIEDNKLGELIITMPPLQLLMLGVVFVPLLEELMFRLPLRYSTRNLTIPFTIFLLLSGSLVVQGNGTTGLSSLSWVITVGLGSVVCAKVLSLTNRRIGERTFARHLVWIVYGSALLFGVVHIPNYPRDAWIVAPILILPQLGSGVLFAYIRIKFGFFWSVFTHGLNNLLVMSPLLLVMTMGSAQLQNTILRDMTDVDLLPHDQVLLGAVALSMLGIVVGMIVTTVRVILEWKRSRQ